MAKTIEELDFKLKIDRKDFDKEIADAKKQAANLNIQLSKLLEIKKAQGNLTNKEYLTLKRLDNLESNRRINAEKELAAQSKRLAAEERVTIEKRKQNTLTQQGTNLLKGATVATLLYAGVQASKKLLSELVQVTGEFEMQRTTLKAMLQDANGANAIYEQIKQLAVVSPFGFKELVTYTKQLAAYSVPIGELYDTTKMLADVSAGIGVSMDRLVLAYGQVRSAAFLRGQEVRQFTEAGIPILDMLAKQFEELEGRVVSTGEVFDKISKRQVPFEMVAKVFKDMTSEGGKFFNMQEIQSETLQGKISNLKDAYEIMLNEIGQNLEPVMKGAVDTLRSLMENYEKVGRTIVELIAVYGTYRTALVITRTLTQGMNATLLTLEGSFKRVGKAIMGTIFKNPYALIAAGATAAAYAIYKMIDGFVGASDMMKNYERNIEKMDSAIVSETAALDALYAKLEVAKEGSKDYDAAKKTIYSKYSEYIAALNEEGVAVDNLATIYADLKNKVLEAARARFIDSASEQAKIDLEAQVTEIQKAFNKRFEKGMVGGPKGFNKATALQKEALWRYITGTSGYDELRKYVPAGWAGFVDWMRKDFKKAADEYKEIIKQIGEAESAFSADNQTTELNGWRKAIADILNEVSSHNISLGLSFNSKNIDTNSLDDVIKEVQKRMEEVTKSRANAVGIENDAVIASYDTQLRYLEEINKVLLGRASIEEKSRGGGAKSQEQKDLETKIDLLKKLQATYDEFKEYATDEQMPDLLSKFFSSSKVEDKDAIIEQLNFRKQILDAAVEMEKYDKEAAEKLRTSVAYDEAKEAQDEYKEEAKRLKEFAKRVDEYVEEAKSNAEKIKDLEKAMNDELAQEPDESRKAAIIAHYTAEIEKLKEELGDITSIQLTDFWQQLTGEKNGTYGNLTRLQKKAEELRDALKGIQEPNRDKNGKITGYTLTQEKHGDILKSLGIDAEEVQLSVSQVEALNKAIDKLIGKRADKNGIFALFDTIKSGGFKKFWEDIKNGGGPAIDILKGVVSQTDELGDIFTEMGNALDSDFLKGLGDAFSVFGGVLGKISDGDLLGAVSEVVKVFTNWITQSARLSAAISQAADEAERLNAASRLSAGVDTLWGTDTITSIRNAVKELERYQQAVEENRKEANRNVTWKSGLFNWGRKTKNLADVVSELGYELYDVYGNLNSEALQTILDTYETLTNADRRWIEEAIRNSELYKNATEQLNDAMKDTWGNLADDMTDKLINARKEVGDAYHALADDLRITFGDMADDIAKKLISSFIQKNILENYNDELAAIYKQIGGGANETVIANAFSSLAESVLNDASLAADFTNRLYDAFDRAGVVFEENSDTLANGIKGITEDTANLLASYVNAIRADVSYGKMQRDSILAEIKNMASYVASPTLMDYINRIQANTFDTAQSNQKILSHIESMMTTDGGFTALRVYS